MFQRRFGSEASARAKKTSPPQATTTAARIACAQATQAPSIPAIASAISGTVSAALTQNLRDMSRSSGFSSGPAPGRRGSSAIPQIGQAPGRSLCTSGCIGQIQSPTIAPACAPGIACAGIACPARPSRTARGSCSNFWRHPAQQKWYVRPSNSARSGAARATSIPQTGSFSVSGAITARLRPGRIGAAAPGETDPGCAGGRAGGRDLSSGSKSALLSEKTTTPGQSDAPPAVGGKGAPSLLVLLAPRARSIGQYSNPIMPPTPQLLRLPPVVAVRLLK